MFILNGSIFLIKSFGRLGFRPNNIVIDGQFLLSPFLINLMVSVLGAVLALIFIKQLQLKLDRN